MSSKQYPTLDFELGLFASGSTLVIGVDEVGRGALFGPVSVGIAVIRRDVHTDGWPAKLADSKLITQKTREELVEPVSSWVEAWAVGSASNREIDEQGITACLALAARRAIGALPDSLRGEVGANPASTTIVLDGSHNWLAGSVGEVRVVTKTKADRDCVSVAAASVLAKVHRDGEMEKLAASDNRFTDYGIAGNKGYSSAGHIEALKKFGPTEHHRVTWLSKILAEDALF